jgi:indole-3-glycerol phosphate synthase
MPATYLDGIMDFHRARAADDGRDWQEREVALSKRPSLTQALTQHRSRGISVIAEIKRRSPSKGWLAEGLDALATARSYVDGGAVAISVLTDEKHFAGSLDDLRAVSAGVDVPVLRKDFTVAPNDVLDAVEAGASAILLIVAALNESELRHLLEFAESMHIDALVEVHDEEEARRALDCGAALVGVNQRDLTTFDVDTQRAERVLAALGTSVVAVAESGFSSVDAVIRAAHVGFDAVLVGENFVRAENPSSAVRSFSGHPIGARS